MSIKRGALIVLEGCDRSGKTTQCKQLGRYTVKQVFNYVWNSSQALRPPTVVSLIQAGRKAIYMNFPNRSTPSGQLINDFLSNRADFEQEAIHLLFTINRWECKRKMEELLLGGTTIVVDRYSYSGVAYSAAKGLSVDWCKGTERNLLKPDLVLLLSLSDEAQRRRGGFGEERYETSDIQRRVGLAFQELFDPAYWREIDADRSVEELQQLLLTEALRTIEAVRPGAEKSLPVLW